MEEVAVNPTIEPQNLHRTGKQTLGGHRQNLVYTRTQKKGAVTTKETDSDLPMSVPGVSGRGVGQWWPAAGLGVLSAAVCAWDLLKEVAIILITSTIVWPQVQQQRGNTAHQQKIGLKIY